MELAAVILGAVTLFIAVVGIAIPLWIERLKMPKLEVTKGEAKGEQPRFLHVSVRNCKHTWWPVKRIQRNPASTCKGRATFYPQDSQVNEECPVTLNGKWETRPEPRIVSVSANGLKETFIEAWVPQGLTEDIGPGEEIQLAIAIKHRGEIEAWGFSSYSYGYPNWEKPEWKLEHKGYKVVIEVSAWNAYATKKFRLINEGEDLESFILEDWNEEKKV